MKKASFGRLFVGLDPGRPTEVLFFVSCPSAFLAVVLGILNDLFYPVEFVSKHDLAQVVLFVAVTTAFALMNIFAHVCLLEKRSSRGDGRVEGLM